TLSENGPPRRGRRLRGTNPVDGKSLVQPGARFRASCSGHSTVAAPGVAWSIRPDRTHNQDKLSANGDDYAADHRRLGASVVCAVASSSQMAQWIAEHST